MNYSEYLLKPYINNASDINAFLQDHLLDNLLIKNKYKEIKIHSHLIHQEDQINIYEQIVFNIDNYITFIKSYLKINELEIRYILSLTLCNSNLDIFSSDKYYYDDIEYYNKEFINIFMNKYLSNIKLLKKYANIEILNFKELCNFINSNKKAHIFFELIEKNNVQYYINLIRSIN